MNESVPRITPKVTPVRKAAECETTYFGECARSEIAKLFILMAGAILAVTGAAKVWSPLGGAKLLAVRDPIIGIQFGHLMLTVGLGEIAVALVCFFSKRQTLPLGLVAWISTNFVVYRLGLWWMGWHRPCSCLGNLTDALHISPQLADNVMKGVLAYLLIGSYAVLLYQWQLGRRSPVEAGDEGIPPTSG